MPIPVKKYYCQFRCGMKASTLANTIWHEERCFKNPKNKACASCKHYKKTKGFCEYDEVELPTSRCDKLDLLCLFDGDNIELYHDGEIIWTNETEKVKGILYIEEDRPIYDKELRVFPTKNCKHWEQIIK